MIPIPVDKLNINLVNFIINSKDYLPFFGLWLAAVNMLPYLIVSFVMLFTVMEDDEIIEIMDMNNVRRGSVLLFTGYVCLYFIYHASALTHDINFYMGYLPLVVILFYICVWKDPKIKNKIISFYHRIKSFFLWLTLLIKT